jgi:hypothetical protein
MCLALLCVVHHIRDLADNPEIIHSFNMGHLLHSAQRLGKYAHFLVEREIKDPDPELLYQKALKVNPNHAANLGRSGRQAVRPTHPSGP